MNELCWRSNLDFFKRVTPSILVCRSTTRGSSNSKSVHTRVRTEVRHEVHVRTEVSRVVDKEEVHVRAIDKEDVRTRAVDEEDMQERVVLAKTIKAQEQMIIDLQRHLFSLEEITKQLKTGPSDVDHLNKHNGSWFKGSSTNACNRTICTMAITVLTIRPNGDALQKCILKGPYTPTIVTRPVVPATEDSLAVHEQTTVETVMNMTPENRAHFESEKEAIHLILTGIRDEIYSTVDACQTA
ncbi:hypothetical protein Tco_1112606 [Tanacetum coccineum]|uniref:Ty3-gypsy retrotransposon protein n=1 Tax=Tanacetum coccineum TaxID=301880 RepID=A0ABQ5IST4_9ASTR